MGSINRRSGSGRLSTPRPRSWASMYGAPGSTRVITPRDPRLSACVGTIWNVTRLGCGRRRAETRDPLHDDAAHIGPRPRVGHDAHASITPKAPDLRESVHADHRERHWIVA